MCALRYWLLIPRCEGGAQYQIEEEFNFQAHVYTFIIKICIKFEEYNISQYNKNYVIIFHDNIQI